MSMIIRDRIAQTYREEIQNFHLTQSDFDVLKGYIDEIRRRKE